jgi:hypothetical protein
MRLERSPEHARDWEVYHVSCWKCLEYFGFAVPISHVDMPFFFLLVLIYRDLLLLRSLNLSMRNEDGRTNGHLLKTRNYSCSEVAGPTGASDGFCSL